MAMTPPPCVSAVLDVMRCLALAGCCASVLMAQGLPPSVTYYGIRQWGWNHFDTDSRLLPIVAIGADSQHTAVVRLDGRLFVQGQDNPGICRAPSGPFVAVDVGWRKALGLRPDGTVEGWGDGFFEGVPPLPVGLTYVGMATGSSHSVFLRSDGAIIASGANYYGQLNVPVLPPGVWPTKVCAVTYNTILLASDGSVYEWGDNADGQCNVPPLPMGVTYTDVSCNQTHSLAVRSDGQLIAWGSNYGGETSVPPLPLGLTYQKCAAGLGWSVAWRSDGGLVAFGSNGSLQLAVPQAPAGASLQQLEAGDGHGVALWSDGSVSGWGQTSYYPFDLPHPTRGNAVASVGDRFSAASVGAGHSLVLRVDGSVEGYGSNPYSICTAPPLPSGLVYTKVRAGYFQSAALRSDGELLAWGENAYGQSNVPPLPVGVTYTDVDAGDLYMLALRSDGAAVGFGLNNFGQCNIPSLPTGMSYVRLDAIDKLSSLLRSDGTVFYMGYGGSGSVSSSVAGVPFVDACVHAAIREDGTCQSWLPWVVPTLPWGTYYVGLDRGSSALFLRRSDGQLLAVHFPPGVFIPPAQSIPALEPGTSYLDVVAGTDSVVARVGGTCTYSGIHPGCAGSMPATRLVPRDTPRIGRTLEVTLFDLPNHVALMAMGWQRVSPPMDLGFLGMPGCGLAVTVDGVAGLAGQASRAKWRLPIPYQSSLLGVRFYNQAMVLDVNAPNPFLAVLSDAMEGVVGWP
jgi:alpha-tubulin suppressor-like RCC1 family protein